MTESDDLLLPEGTRILHIGPEKTGTTAVQFAFKNARDRLRADGVCYPGKGARPRDAAFVMVGKAGPRGRPAPSMEAWHELVREVADAGDQRVFVSDEAFAAADADAAKAIVDGLGGPRAHVVLVARRVDKLLASQWQQRVQAGLTLPYDEFLGRILGDDPEDPHWARFWGIHDLSELVGRWAKAAGPDRVTVVVADESDRGLLPRLFERFLGLEPGYLELVQDRTNRSLSLNEIEMLRQVGIAFAEHKWSDDVFRQLYRFGVVGELRRSAPQPGDRRITMPPWAVERTAEINAQRIETVRSLDVRVLGDPELLRTSPEAPAEIAPATDEQVRVPAETAASAVTATIEAALRRERATMKEHRRELTRARWAPERETTGGARRGLEDATARELIGALRSKLRRRLRRR